MANQMSFEDIEGIVDPFEGADPDLVRRFYAYHERNPHIFAKFTEMAEKMRKVRPRYSAWTIINVIRWDADVSTSGDEFKISNDYIALYARLLVHVKPEFVGFFELKQMKSKRKKQGAA